MQAHHAKQTFLSANGLHTCVGTLCAGQTPHAREGTCVHCHGAGPLWVEVYVGSKAGAHMQREQHLITWTSHSASQHSATKAHSGTWQSVHAAAQAQPFNVWARNKPDAEVSVATCNASCYMSMAQPQV
jgi:hypothetical protein